MSNHLDLEVVIERYANAKDLTSGTRREYRATVRKWKEWNHALSLADLNRKLIREFLDWVYQQAVDQEGRNPVRTANKSRQNLRAVMAWAWEHDLIDTLPRFPASKPQRDVAGRHYLTKGEINAIYFATYNMRPPRTWKHPVHIGRYWRCALAVATVGVIEDAEPEHWHSFQHLRPTN